MSTRAQIVLAVLTLPGCDYVLGLERNDAPDGGGNDAADAMPEAPATSACFHDKFDGASSMPDSKYWRPHGNPSPAIDIQVGNDALAITYFRTGSGREPLISQKAFDFTDATLAAVFTGAPTGLNTSTSIGLETVEGIRLYRIELSPNVLTCYGPTAMACTTSMTARAGHVRLRHSSEAGGRMFFETSPDGGTFQPIVDIAASAPVDDVLFVIDGNVAMAGTPIITIVSWDEVLFQNATCGMQP